VRLLGGSAALFVSAKAAVFLAPIGLSIVLDATGYGRFEYALAWATPASLALGLGIGGAVPYFVLKRERAEYEETFRLYVALVGVMGLVLGACAWRAGLSGVAFGSLVATAMAAQTITSSTLKTHGAAGRASVLESGVYLAVLAAMPALRYARGRPLGILAIAVAAYVLVLLGTALYRLRLDVSARAHLRRFRIVIAFGVPVLVSSILMGLLTSSGRLLAGQFLSLETVAAYGFFFRLSSAVMLVHQLANALYFPRIYTAAGPALDRYFGVIAALVLGTAVVGFSLSSVVLPPVLPRFVEFRAPHAGVYWALSMQMLFWSAVAQGELILYREGMARAVSAVVAIGVALLFAATWILDVLGALTLLRLCAVQVLCMASVYFVEVWLLRRAGVILRRVPLLLGAATVVFALSYSWLELHHHSL
jgi:O-antigen/teichoic acid export membrane protein